MLLWGDRDPPTPSPAQMERRSPIPPFRDSFSEKMEARVVLTVWYCQDMDERRNVKVDLRLSVSERDRWARCAGERGVSLSSMIRQAVSQWLSEPPTVEEIATAVFPRGEVRVVADRPKFKPDFGGRLKG